MRRVGRVLFVAGTAVLTLLITGLGAAASAQDLPAPLRSTKLAELGAVLVGPNGMTLYVYVNDRESGKSVCTGQCETNWPPFRPAADAAAPRDPLAVIVRLDGSRQYAWKGKPLYFCKTDKKPGDVTGHKFRDFWLAAQP